MRSLTLSLRVDLPLVLLRPFVRCWLLPLLLFPVPVPPLFIVPPDPLFIVPPEPLLIVPPEPFVPVVSTDVLEAPPEEPTPMLSGAATPMGEVSTFIVSVVVVSSVF